MPRYLEKRKLHRLKQSNTPSNYDFFGIYSMVQLVHCTMVLPVDRNLLLTFTMRHGI